MIVAIASDRRLAALVARPGLERDPRRLPGRRVGVGRRCRRAQPRSRSSRAQHRLADRDRPGDGAAEAALPARLLRLLRRAARERGPARPDRRARAGRGADAEDARRRTARWATLVGTVFAHRVFDIVPALLLIGYVLATADIPDWALTSLIAVVSVGSAALPARLLQRTPAPPLGARGGRDAEAGRDDGALRARRDARAAARRRRDLLPVPGLALPVLRRLHGDAGLRHPRAAARCRRSCSC